MLYEHPETGFPEQIQLNLKNQENLMETILFFRNVQIENHLKAKKLAKSNYTVIIDTPFYQNQLFIDLYIKDQFSKEILYKLGEHDLLAYKPSDVTIYIRTNIQLVKRFLKRRHGERVWEEDSWFNFIAKMPPKVDLFMNKIEGRLNNLITLDRELYDFSKEEDKQKLFTILKKIDFGKKKAN